ncbi:MAG: GNAT family N-acetyltransferase [Eubacteriales bacterium]|nr:GNAT family N-acetyltransferase [Eubacteriales bacterium]
MKLTSYDNTASFGADTLEILLENEAQNNLPISFIRNEHGYDTSDWLMATVRDDAGGVVLTAARTPPFNIVLYETGNKPNEAALRLLCRELKGMSVDLPGVLAEQGLAYRFAGLYAGAEFVRHISMNIMRLDRLNNIERAPGFCRPLREDDLFFVPYWERSFQEECGVEVYDIVTNVSKIKRRTGKDTHFIWEDGNPVSQACTTRNTQNGGGINGVYTPPHYRSRGYASSVTAELSRILLERGNKFCFLFADAENPVSCGMYHKIGYYDLCVYDEIRFNKGR